MKFVQLILRKMIKTVATRCQILRLKMHQIRFRLGLSPRPRCGSLRPAALPRPAGFKEAYTSKGKEGRGVERGEGGERRDKEKGKGKGGESVPLPRSDFTI